MAKTTQPTANEPIEIVDLPEENSDGGNFNLLLLISLTVAIATGIFLIIRFLKKEHGEHVE